VHGAQGPREVGEEDEGALERRDEQRLAAGVVACDLGAELLDAGRDRLGREEDLPETGIV
jgi:hypothetical protein